MHGYLSSWVPAHPGAALRRPRRSLPFPLDDPRCRLYRFGRQALWHGLRSLALEPGDQLLVPAYHHGSEVGTLVDAGLEPVFYDATGNLEPDPDALERLITDRTRALYLIHTLGFSLDAERWRTWCDERGLVLVEDVAQAWLAERDGRPLGSWGQVAFWSPWKTYGLPDAGALLCESPPPAVPVERGVEWREHAVATVKWFAGRWSRIADLRPPGGGAGFDADSEFSVGNPDAGISRASLAVLRRVATTDTAARRRANHARLLELLGDRVPAPFDVVGSCPFFCPVETDDKLGLIKHLADRDIAAFDFWAVPHPLLDTDRFPGATTRRRRTVALPVHQELRPRDLDRIAAAVLEFESADRHGPVDVGDPAPDFELLDQDGDSHRLSQHRGEPVILYFYPEADTPGCTAQACGLRDRMPTLDGFDAVVLGVSPDEPAKLRAFADRHGLEFRLVADTEHDVAKRYGVWRRVPGLVPHWENERTTFIVAPDGAVARVLRAVNPALHDGLVTEALEELAAARAAAS